MTWREPDLHKAAFAALAALPEPRAAAPATTIKAALIGVVGVGAVAAGTTLARRFKRHGGKRYSRLPMSGVELDTRSNPIAGLQQREGVRFEAIHRG